MSYPTHDHGNPFVERINASIPVSEIETPLRIGLSSTEGTLAQIEISSATVGRHMGKKVLELVLTDRSGMEVLAGEASTTLRLRLGRTAIVGRGRLDLPVLESPAVSEDHLRLNFTKGTYGYELGIQDIDSINGSHFTTEETERSWQDQINELSADTQFEHHDNAVDPTAYDWVFDRSAPKPTDSTQFNIDL